MKGTKSNLAFTHKPMSHHTNQNSKFPYPKKIVAPSVLKTDMTLKEFLNWANKKEDGDEQEHVKEINTSSHFGQQNLGNQKPSSPSISLHNFAFQVRQPILPVGCVALYLGNKMNKRVNVIYKLKILEKSNDNQISVHSETEGNDTIDAHSFLYLDDCSIKGLKEKEDADDQVELQRPINAPTGKLVIICDIEMVCKAASKQHSSSSHRTRQKAYSSSERLILYI